MPNSPYTGSKIHKNNDHFIYSIPHFKQDNGLQFKIYLNLTLPFLFSIPPEIWDWHILGCRVKFIKPSTLWWPRTCGSYRIVVNACVWGCNYETNQHQIGTYLLYHLTCITVGIQWPYTVFYCIFSLRVSSEPIFCAIHFSMGIWWLSPLVCIPHLLSSLFGSIISMHKWNDWPY